MRWPVPRLTWPGFQHLPNIPTDESLESQWNCDSSGLFPVFKRNHIIVVDVPSIFHPSLPTENHINIPSKSQKKHINIPSNLLRFPVFLRLHLHPIHLRLRDRELPWIALRAQFFLAKCGGFTWVLYGFVLKSDVHTPKCAIWAGKWWYTNGWNGVPYFQSDPYAGVKTTK